jgi:hypothetical protein
MKGFIQYLHVITESVDNPFIEGVPTEEKVKSVKKWLSDNLDKYNPIYVNFYHATHPDLPIEEEGLLPTSNGRKRSYQSQIGYVYLANTPERAKTFGDLAYGINNSVIYEVAVRVQDLKADLDQIRNQRITGVDIGNSVAESIVYGGGVRVKKKIEPWQIKRVSLE